MPIRKKQEDRFPGLKKALVIGWIVVSQVLIVSMCLFLLPYVNTYNYSGGAVPVSQLSSATISWDDYSEEVTLPVKLKDIPTDTEITVTFHFDNQNADLYAEVRTAFAPLTVQVNGTTTYIYGGTETRPSFMKDPATSIHLVAVNNTGNTTVVLKYRMPKTRNTLTINPLLLSNQAGLLRYHLRKDGVVMGQSFLMFIGGIIWMIVSFMVMEMDKKGNQFLLLGLFSSLVGMWGISNCDTALFFFNTPNLWYLLSYAGFFEFLLPLVYFLKDSVLHKEQKMMQVIKVSLMVMIMAAYILQFTGIIMFTQSVRLFQIVLPVFYFMMTIAVFYEAMHDHNHGAALWCVPMGILAVFTVLELRSYMVASRYSGSDYFITGALIFCLFMCVIGGIQIRASIRISRKEKEQENQLAILNMEVTEQKKYQDAMIEHEKQLRRQRHDFRHQLRILQELGSSGDMEQMQKYISTMISSMPSTPVQNYCDNLSINAVLSYYAGQAENAGAKITLAVNVPSDLSETITQHLCLIFGNLLENACEAVSRIHDEKVEKKITLTAGMHFDNLVIHMENSCDGRTQKWGKFYISSKRNEVGIGLTSIASIASLYKGDANFETKENTFISNVYLTIPQE
jgi:sensor histidine kinase YesM